jgi:outer membrane lipoprotein SlyB
MMRRGHKRGLVMGVSRLRRSTALLLVFSLAASDLAGCAAGGLGSSKVDTSDACGVQHRDFYDSKNYYENKALAGAVEGAVGGAILGGLLAAATGGNVARGAAIGAGTGAVAGAYAGYWNAKQKDYQDQTQLANSIYGDVRQASTEMDRVDHTFALLKQCRFEVAARAKADYKSGAITRDQAASQLADQQRRFKDEIVLARQYGAKMAEQDQSFHFAANNLAKDDPAAQQALQRKAQPASAGAAPSPGGGLAIVSAANIRKAPDARAERVGGAFPGDPVQALEPAANGWQHVSIKGVEGYVTASALGQPGAAPAAAPAATTQTAATQPAAPAAESGDKKVQVAEVTGTIPEKRAHYDKSVDGAEKDSQIAFNLDQSGTSG